MADRPLHRRAGHSRRVVLLAAVCAAVSAAGGAFAAPQTHTVVIEGMHFTPETLTVKRGDRVQWVNKDLFPHTATAGSKAFDSGPIAAGASWSMVAGRAGTLPYVCTLHPTMAGTLIVEQVGQEKHSP
jgi:plastocyanin